MATITITPGESFNPTEAVTSTKLNDLGSPTAALAPASIGTADIADDAITLDKVNANAVGTSQLIDDSVNSDPLKDDIVTSDLMLNVMIEHFDATLREIGLLHHLFCSQAIRQLGDGVRLQKQNLFQIRLNRCDGITKEI